MKRLATMSSWIELENTYLTNQPLISGRGGPRVKLIPDPSLPPTEAYLCVYLCRRRKRGIDRRRSMRVLEARTQRSLERKIRDFVKRRDVILIEDQQKPFDYTASRDEPVPLELRAAGNRR